MTDLLDAYLTHRDQGHRHHAALLALARRFHMDRGTVARSMGRAQAEHERTQRKEANA